MWDNEEENNIIDGFIRALRINFMKSKYDYRFYFKNGDRVIARYIAEAESDNDLDMDDPDYEEFYEFYFKILKIEKRGKGSKLDKRSGLPLNYHNFPIKWELYEGDVEKDNSGE